MNLYPPAPWTIRLVWYPIGVKKLADAAIAIVMKKGLGLTPNCDAAERAIGNTKAAAALFVINSVKIIVKKC